MKAEKPKPAPKKADTFHPDARAKAHASIAAMMLIDGFQWSTHPWGEDFWCDVQSELNRIAEIE